ncbi:hypothetical protein M408DRAFT_289770 [Serendipita vermifera MAFF 305830]|uniref:N-acetyltransferase domain-containing protein n=1 Tax=Serendipita vermifera MAFF 305830 TaxID=933852 RepID=A0A0C2WX64_SERVB|nr:hypothetical protein M408DRAFT_289770 [Serendipita vermifera MAFF 305830]
MPLTLQVFDNPQLFLQAIDNASNTVDSPSMNLVIGGAHDSSQTPGSNQRSIWMILHGQQGDGEEAIEISYDAQLASPAPICMALCSQTLETYHMATQDTENGLLSKTPQLFDAVIRALDDAKLPQIHSMFGPKPCVDEFLARWGAHVDPPLQLREQPFLDTRLAYMSLSEYHSGQREDGKYEILDLVTVPYDRSSPEMAAIHKQLVECVLDFWEANAGNEERSAAAERMINDVLDAREAGRIWICRPFGHEGEMAGYLYTGRETKHTIAIRNVYTREAFRGKGVARELVVASCKWWLLDVDVEKRKQAVTLFVAPSNVAATKSYLRSGFSIRDEPWEWRGFEDVSMGAF